MNNKEEGEKEDEKANSNDMGCRTGFRRFRRYAGGKDDH
jgi:hypothetical protein